MLEINGKVGYSTEILSIQRLFEQGKIYGIQGRNGCGKSTLLRTLSGEIRPLRGQVTLGGENVTDRRLIGDIVHISTPKYYPDLSIGEHLKLLEKSQRISCDGAIEAWELSEILEVSPARVSSGQQQRFSLAAQLSGDSRALLLDEPERHLDDQWIEVLCSVLLTKAKSGTIVISASHSKRILNLCDETILLS